MIFIAFHFTVRDLFKDQPFNIFREEWTTHHSNTCYLISSSIGGQWWHKGNIPQEYDIVKLFYVSYIPWIVSQLFSACYFFFGAVAHSTVYRFNDVLGGLKSVKPLFVSDTLEVAESANPASSCSERQRKEAVLHTESEQQEAHKSFTQLEVALALQNSKALLFQVLVSPLPHKLVVCFLIHWQH